MGSFLYCIYICKSLVSVSWTLSRSSGDAKICDLKISMYGFNSFDVFSEIGVYQKQKRGGCGIQIPRFVCFH